MFQAISDNYDPDNLGSLKPFPFYLEIARMIFSPILVIGGLVLNLMLPHDHNAINNRKEITGIRKGYFWRNLDVAKMKACSKKNGCNINELTISLISMTMHEYFKRH